MTLFDTALNNETKRNLFLDRHISQKMRSTNFEGLLIKRKDRVFDYVELKILVENQSLEIDVNGKVFWKAPWYEISNLYAVNELFKYVYEPREI